MNNPGLFRPGRTCKAVVEFRTRAGANGGYAWSQPVQLFFSYPYKLFIPHPTVRVREPTRWIYPMVYGGGLVSGDFLQLEILCGTASSILLTSPAFNKVYKATKNHICKQINDFTVKEDALLSVLPDLMICYASSRYSQTQKIHLQESTSSIIYLDWFASGRIAYQERWQFEYLHSSLEIYLKDDLILRENLVLEDIEGLSVLDRMKNFDVFGLLIIYGTTAPVDCLKKSVVSALSKREEYGISAESQNIFCCSLTKHDVCVVRFVCTDSRSAYIQIEKLLTPMFKIYGGSPFFNKY